MLPYHLRSVLLCVVLASIVQAPASAVLQQALPAQNSLFGIRLEFNKDVYHLGEPIEVRVTLINKTSRRYSIEWAPPYGICRLRVLNGQGNALTSKGSWGYRSDMDTIELPPGKAVVVRYPDPSGKGLLQWATIEHWGYSLNRPGYYSIAAAPTLEGVERIGSGEGPDFTASGEYASNVVHIKVSL